MYKFHSTRIKSNIIIPLSRFPTKKIFGKILSSSGIKNANEKFFFRFRVKKKSWKEIFKKEIFQRFETRSVKKYSKKRSRNRKTKLNSPCKRGKIFKNRKGNAEMTKRPLTWSDIARITYSWKLKKEKKEKIQLKSMYPEEKREIRNAKDTPSGTRRISKRAKRLSRTLDPKEDAYNNVSTLLSYSSLPFNEKFLASIIPFDINILQQLISSHEKLRISVRATLVIK